MLFMVGIKDILSDLNVPEKDFARFKEELGRLHALPGFAAMRPRGCGVSVKEDKITLEISEGRHYYGGRPEYGLLKKFPPCWDAEKVAAMIHGFFMYLDGVSRDLKRLGYRTVKTGEYERIVPEWSTRLSLYLITYVNKERWTVCMKAEDVDVTDGEYLMIWYAPADSAAADLAGALERKMMELYCWNGFRKDEYFASLPPSLRAAVAESRLKLEDSP
ncbi:MAG: hypothetical protein J6Y62_01815 [Clostridia bacterium]|nr:hypothetical protein [Clostridia bacterium]